MNIEAVKDELMRLGMSSPKIVYYDMTDSTNTRAREYARDTDRREPVVFVADGQTAGRGRRGRSFFSESGAGIYVSFLVYPTSRGASATNITAYAAVSLARAVCGCSRVSPLIKWVNDLYINDKKLAGILAECEMSSDGEISHLVLGMGINVYKTELPDEISSIATSIEDASGEKISREILLARIIFEFLSNLSDAGSDEVYEEYKSRLFVLGREITVVRMGERYRARAVSLTREFSLVTESENYGRECLYSGEISTEI
ncbi:MAG: biotin--[Clostridia bacterium]|nr:biotin--[acetyl-CoA-carboxylase] ligase [Clostridia bacterium]